MYVKCLDSDEMTVLPMTSLSPGRSNSKQLLLLRCRNLIFWKRKTGVSLWRFDKPTSLSGSKATPHSSYITCVLIDCRVQVWDWVGPFGHEAVLCFASPALVSVSLMNWARAPRPYLLVLFWGAYRNGIWDFATIVDCKEINHQGQFPVFTWRHGGHVWYTEQYRVTSRRPCWCTELQRKKSFGNLILLLCKTWATFCHCFLHQHGRFITWVKTKNRAFLSSPQTLFQRKSLWVSFVSVINSSFNTNETDIRNKSFALRFALK